MDHYYYCQRQTCDESARRDRTVKNPRPLTHDEQKAAEAAFRHQPFNPVWSQAALLVYAGITAAMDQTTA